MLLHLRGARSAIPAPASLPLAKASQRVKGIEPSCPAWEAGVLPLNYTRGRIFDSRFSIADLQAAKLLPGNYVVGAGEFSGVTKGEVLAERPRNHALMERFGTSAIVWPVRIWSDLIIVIGIYSDDVSRTPGIMGLTVAPDFSFWAGLACIFSR